MIIIYYYNIFILYDTCIVTLRTRSLLTVFITYYILLLVITTQLIIILLLNSI